MFALFVELLFVFSLQFVHFLLEIHDLRMRLAQLRLVLLQSVLVRAKGPV